MTVRPIARDQVPGSGWPVVAARHVHDGVAACATPVTHSYAVVVFQTAGRSRVELGAAWTLDVGDVLLLPAGMPHRTLERAQSELWGLSFCVSCFAAEGAASLLEPLERVRDGGAAVVRIPTERQGYLASLFAEVEQVGLERRGSNDTLDAVQRSLLTLILAEVGRAASDARHNAGGGVVVDALRFIERKCLAPLSLDDIAAAVGRSATYVTTALKQATGRSASQWIVSGRMAEARRLLLHSDERIDIIAERVGYADATHFIRMFRREHGATPAAWRTAQARGPKSG